MHSKPGFVFDASTTKSTFFYDRQLKNSVKVRSFPIPLELLFYFLKQELYNSCADLVPFGSSWIVVGPDSCISIGIEN